MTTTRTYGAIIALVFALNTPIAAQKSWTPLQKEWFAKIMHLIAVAQKPVSNNKSTSSTAACAISNEIIIVVAPCSESSEKGKTVLSKPVQ